MVDSADASETSNKKVQTPSDGSGPRYHRTYSIQLPVSYESARRTMDELKLNPTKFSPELIAVFDKTKGEKNSLDVGDEFMIRISGPWNGPVRVSQVSESSFTLVTLEGHLEAGQIQFSLHSRDDGTSKFQIESITRSKDKIVDFFYDKLRLAQFAQSEMWELVCKNFAKDSLGGEVASSPVEIHTDRQDEKTGEWSDVSGQIGSKGLDSKAD